MPSLRAPRVFRVSCLVVPALLLALAAACERSPAPTGAAHESRTEGRTEIRVSVDETGYHPAESHARAGAPVRLIVTRTTDAGCGHQIVVPSAQLKRDLPLGVPVAIDLTMPPSGRLAFACGMDMMQGAIVAD